MLLPQIKAQPQPITELEPWWKDEPDLGVLQSSIGKRTKTKIVTREKTSYTKVKHTTYIPTGWGFGLRVNPMKESKKEKPIDPVKQAQRKAAKITKMQQRKTEQIQKQKEAKRKGKRKNETFSH